MTKWFYIFLFIALFQDCKSFIQEVDLAVECSSTVECGSITLSGTTATYPLYFNINIPGDRKCYYKPDNLAATGQVVKVSNDECNCDCSEWWLD